MASPGDESVHWLIEEVDHANDFAVAHRLGYAVQERGHPVTTFKYVPFGEMDWGFIPQAGPLVYYGGWNALADIRRRGVATPGPFAWCDFDKFKCSVYYRELRGFIAQEDVRFLELSQLDEGAFGDDARLFIRPDDNEKTFCGQLVDRDLCFAFVRDVAAGGDLRIVVARPQPIRREWRVVIVAGEAVSASQYKRGPAVEIAAGSPPGVRDFAEEVAAAWSPHPVFVVDVCELAGRGYRVMEIGPFNYAGLYRCDLGPIVDAINAHVLRSASDSPR